MSSDGDLPNIGELVLRAAQLTANLREATVRGYEIISKSRNLLDATYGARVQASRLNDMAEELLLESIASRKRGQRLVRGFRGTPASRCVAARSGRDYS